MKTYKDLTEEIENTLSEEGQSYTINWEDGSGFRGKSNFKGGSTTMAINNFKRKYPNRTVVSIETN